MAKVVSEKQVNTFVKGLITEASPLTFPENSSLDEVNFDLELNGSRSRRLGVDYEVGYQLNSTTFTAPYLATTKVSAHSWKSPGNSSTISMSVVRVGDKLWFLNSLSANPSANLLNSGSSITITGLGNNDIETSEINGYLIIVGKDLTYPIILEYFPDTDTVFQQELYLKVRDIWGVDDGLEANERPSNLIGKHLYNLINQGWNHRVQVRRISSEVLYTANALAYSNVSPACVYVTYEYNGYYPSNSDIWSLGKSAITTDTYFDQYSATILNKNSIDNTSISLGSNIIDMFNRGNSRYVQPTAKYYYPILPGNLYGTINSLPADREQGTISTIASYAGRVFYAGVESNIVDSDSRSPNYSNYIFFTQTILNKDSFHKCYQENDPTSPNISDLLDTDGGTIQIPEITRIVKIISAGSSLIVLAENGVWEVFGDTNGFVATSFQVNKITSVGVSNPKAVVDANGTIVYWAKSGIYALVPDQTGRYKAQNISLTTIQSYYTSIPYLAKANARGFYDEIHNHIRWLYNSDDTYSETNYINNYNKELNLDLTLSSFYVYDISSLETNSPMICDYISIPGHSLSTLADAIYVGNDPVQITSTDSVVINIPVSTPRTATYYFLTLVGTDFTLSQYRDRTFHDWVTASGSTGVNYESYLVTGYELFGDILRYKQVPYILFYFERTEDGFTTVGTNLEIDNPSSCLVQAQWNWTNSANSGKWGSQFQAYRLLRNYVPSGAGDTFDYGDRVIVTKNKLRGSGRSLSLKIQAEEGKDMKLLGWAMEVTGNSKP